MLTDARRSNVEAFAFSRFEKNGAVLRGGHFVYASEMHGTIYVSADAIFADPEEFSMLVFYLSEMVLDSGLRKQAEVILGPAVGGILMAQEFARHMSRAVSRKIYNAWAEKTSGCLKNPFVIPDAFEKYISGKNVFLIDDVVTTGTALKNVSSCVYNFGGNVIGAACLWNRGGVQPFEAGQVPFFSLIEKQFESYREEDCPLCKLGVPVNTGYGHGKNFLKKKKQPYC